VGVWVGVVAGESEPPLALPASFTAALAEGECVGEVVAVKEGEALVVLQMERDREGEDEKEGEREAERELEGEAL
jgi:hypothetical protein